MPTSITLHLFWIWFLLGTAIGLGWGVGSFLIAFVTGALAAVLKTRQ